MNLPELPEVETVCEVLRQAKFSAAVKGVWRSDFNLRIGKQWRREQEGWEQIRGRRPQMIARRGKYILWSFASTTGEEALELLLHLGMSGQIALRRRGQDKAKHTHLSIDFEDERRVDFVDPRRFGGLKVDSPEGHRRRGILKTLGPEPLSRAFGAKYLQDKMCKRSRAIRDTLLDQRIVAGIGNIYAVEALFAAKVRPQRPAQSLSAQECELLVKAIKAILRRAIAKRGTTFRDYRDPEGSRGDNQSQLKVYGRGEQPCRRCGAELKTLVLGGRSAVYCPVCQL